MLVEGSVGPPSPSFPSPALFMGLLLSSLYSLTFFAWVILYPPNIFWSWCASIHLEVLGKCMMGCFKWCIKRTGPNR
ncbi:hypothetical protein VNO77_27476 [Canavalia gladiata]|uniref:Uncharacterized protein n=1 Tax=Canavalia gladiata TaxID=3824 RepID=A0AAN9Q6I0_CANGL